MTKTMKVSNQDYRRLEWLGSDHWMAIKGEPPRPVSEVLHRIIEGEYEKANPTRYGAYER
jgi:hypothetical protein